ncbi:hypothetical protein BC830DRAFT_1111057 [Chytriomyces sp. MP71]|nr:hypothetical protein BC830DRAFT_1111057 [Chytriomyces sp. MP71]
MIFGGCPPARPSSALSTRVNRDYCGEIEVSGMRGDVASLASSHAAQMEDSGHETRRERDVVPDEPRGRGSTARVRNNRNGAVATTRKQEFAQPPPPRPSLAATSKARTSLGSNPNLKGPRVSTASYHAQLPSTSRNNSDSTVTSSMPPLAFAAALPGQQQQVGEQPPEQPVVLITGCSRGGIGHALCIALATKGCRVFGSVRCNDALADLDDCVPKDCCGSAVLILLDVKSLDSVKGAIQTVISATGRIDILINNAGIGLSGGVAETNPESVRSLFETNVIGMLNVTQEVVPHMLERGVGGKIVNMGSMLAYISLPWSGAYCASKSALRALTSSLRMELAPLGIQVSLVSAGSVKSNLIENIRRRTAHSPTRASPIFDALHGSCKRTRQATAHNALAGGTDVHEFAETVATGILRPRMDINLMTGRWWWMVLLFLQFPEPVIEWVLMWRFALFGRVKMKDSALIGQGYATKTENPQDGKEIL